jgi:dihydrodipicolinate synthase/N-acetylneuraminate lyase
MIGFKEATGDVEQAEETWAATGQRDEVETGSGEGEEEGEEWSS